MQRARDELFSRAGFTENADAGFARGYALHLRHHAAHGLAFPDDFVFAETVCEVAIFAFEPAEFQRILDGEQQFFSGDRFFQKIERAEPRGANRHLDVRLTRHHDDRSSHALRFELFEQREAVFAGHHHVGENQIEGLRLGQIQSLVCVVAHGSFVTFQTKRPR